MCSACLPTRRRPYNGRFLLNWSKRAERIACTPARSGWKLNLSEPMGLASEVSTALKCGRNGPTLMSQRLKWTEQRGDSGTPAQFGEDSAGGVAIGFAGVGGIGPHRVVDDLRSFFHIHVQGRFADIKTLLQLLITRFADFCDLEFSRMVVGEVAGRGGSGRCFDRGGQNLRLELPQEFFTFFLKGNGIDLRFSAGLHLGGFGQNRQYSFPSVATGTGIKICCVVQMAFRTGQPVPNGLSGGYHPTGRYAALHVPDRPFCWLHLLPRLRPT